MPNQLFDLAVIGHFSIDSIKLPSNPNPYQIMGGSVAYFSLIARRLGSSVAVFSKVGSDFPVNYLRQLSSKGVDTSGILTVTNEQTTSFELAYNENLSSRTLKLRRYGSAISISDLPHNFYAKAIHIAPIDCEISCEVIEHLKSWGGCISIDPQGITRHFGPDGNVTYGGAINKRLLSLVDIYKSAYDEIVFLTGQSDLKQAIKAVHNLGPKIVIVTMGAQGAVLSAEDKIYNIPAYPSEKIIDPTGAGDVFIGAFLAEFIRKEDLLWCACVGSSAASIVVEGIGTTFLSKRSEIYRRAQIISK